MTIAIILVLVLAAVCLPGAGAIGVFFLHGRWLKGMYRQIQKDKAMREMEHWKQKIYWKEFNSL